MVGEGMSVGLNHDQALALLPQGLLQEIGAEIENALELVKRCEEQAQEAIEKIERALQRNKEAYTRLSKRLDAFDANWKDNHDVWLKPMRYCAANMFTSADKMIRLRRAIFMVATLAVHHSHELQEPDLVYHGSTLVNHGVKETFTLHAAPEGYFTPELEPHLARLGVTRHPDPETWLKGMGWEKKDGQWRKQYERF